MRLRVSIRGLVVWGPTSDRPATPPGGIMSHRSRKEVEAENLVLLDKLEAVRNDLTDFLGDADDDAEDSSSPGTDDEAADEDDDDACATD